MSVIGFRAGLFRSDILDEICEIDSRIREYLSDQFTEKRMYLYDNDLQDLHKDKSIIQKTTLDLNRIRMYIFEQSFHGELDHDLFLERQHVLDKHTILE